jgi:hypothetical protein
VYVGHSLAQAVSHWPVTVEAWVQTKTSEYGIYGGLSSLGAGFCVSTSFLPSLSFHLRSILTHSSTTGTI